MNNRLILITLVVLLTLSPVPLELWTLQAGSLIRVSNNFSSWQIHKPNPVTGFDFGSDQDCLETGNQSIKIVDCQNKTNTRWQTPKTWKVTEAISADLNRDGKNEMVMVVWRRHEVWPIDSFLPSGGRIASFHDRSLSSCHLILVGWDGNEYRELWAGSSLINPVFNILAADLDNDGYQELISLEGKYDSWNRTGNLTAWDWSGFGFRLRDRQNGNFSKIGIVSVDQNVMIMTD